MGTFCFFSTLRNGNHRRTEHPFLNHPALLENRCDRAGLLPFSGRDHCDCLVPVLIKLFTDGFKALHAGNLHGVNQLPIDGKKTVLHQALFLLSMFHRLLKGIHHGKQVRRELVDAELKKATEQK